MSTDASPFAIPDEIDVTDVHRESLNVFSQMAQKLIEIRTSIDDTVSKLPSELKRARIFMKCPNPSDIKTSNNTIDLIVSGGTAAERTITVRNLDADPPVYANCQEIVADFESISGLNAYPMGNSILIETTQEGEDARIEIGADDTAHEIFGYKGPGYVYDSIPRNYSKDDNANDDLKYSLDLMIREMFEMASDFEMIGPDHENG